MITFGITPPEEHMGARLSVGRFEDHCGAHDHDPSWPIRRLVAREAWCGIVIGSVTLPYMTPAAAAVPDWAQLLGLAMLVRALMLRLHCWRELIAQGLRRSGMPASARLREQVRGERRIRLGAFAVGGATVALLPIPPTWVGFWFALGVATIALAAMTLVAQQTATVARRRPLGPRPRPRLR
ncbi:hypothetical protein [Nocardia sp. bgisy134]|uniref:hypothetical protein n=1 Tax=Nocardia sp. bgisy134 TaxID=3413789 RepID=UPI003D741972